MLVYSSLLHMSVEFDLVGLHTWLNGLIIGEYVDIISCLYT